MQVVRTPDTDFDGLSDFPWQPRFVDIVDGDGTVLRMAYIDAGPKDGECLLCLHGQPTWSYLWRHMIPHLVSAGYRVIAPDLIGFGRSDKPAHRSDYTYRRHVAWMAHFVETLDLRQITLVCQDWGGLIGLRVVADLPDRFARIVVSNTGLPDARNIPDAMAKPMHDLFDRIPALPPGEMGRKLRENEFGAGFMYWIRYCSDYPDFVISDVVNLSSGGRLTATQKAAYDAPFPDETFKQGARQFPSLVPIFPDSPDIEDNRRTWKFFEAWQKPLLTAFGDNDPVTEGGWKRFQETVPGARNQPHVTLTGAGHFTQEDAPEPFAKAIITFCKANPLP